MTTVGRLDIKLNNALTDLELSNLQRIDSLGVFKNKTLTDLSGIENLQIADFIWIGDNDSMVSLAGFPSSMLELGSLVITENKEFSNIDDLFHLQHIRSSLTIRSNRKLCRQRVDALVDHLTTTGGTIPNVSTQSNLYCN